MLCYWSLDAPLREVQRHPGCGHARTHPTRSQCVAGQLRRYFGDELLTRVGNSDELTRMR